MDLADFVSRFLCLPSQLCLLCFHFRNFLRHGGDEDRDALLHEPPEVVANVLVDVRSRMLQERFRLLRQIGRPLRRRRGRRREALFFRTAFCIGRIRSFR